MKAYQKVLIYLLSDMDVKNVCADLQVRQNH